jgi:hypothetical protein
VPEVVLVTNTDHEYADAGWVRGEIRSFPLAVLVQCSTN